MPEQYETLNALSFEFEGFGSYGPGALRLFQIHWHRKVQLWHMAVLGLTKHQNVKTQNNAAD